MWNEIFVNFSTTRLIALLFKMQNWFLIGSLVKNVISRNLTFIYEIAICYSVSLEDYKSILRGYPVKMAVLETILKEINY